ncbi:hypothetical protein [Lapillicoccus jejuensis]|uniref:Flagellar assembly protein FliH n=1 Tax=Lapillicoccus jejuensis TaxID=402171 RepID=A0A542E4H6_9MICO|nr:hypothetical protein [Lapillicoccus jejuensis]TQJ10164.1 flagellar assembly protein FliH [Lapillicoccus jejuensis]
MTSSPETRPATLVRGASAERLRTPDLRTSLWTRLGDDEVRGDATTESVLDGLAERTRDAARSQGFSIGWSQGRRAAAEDAERVRAVAAAQLAHAEEQRRLEHAAALAALHEAAARLERATAGATAAVHEQASELALALTEELVGHALRTETTEDVVRRAAGLVRGDGRGTARLRLHPDVAATLSADDLPGVTVVGDPTLPRSGAVAELDDALVRFDADAALGRLREVLR